MLNTCCPQRQPESPAVSELAELLLAQKKNGRHAFLGPDGRTSTKASRQHIDSPTMASRDDSPARPDSASIVHIVYFWEVFFSSGRCFSVVFVVRWLSASLTRAGTAPDPAPKPHAQRGRHATLGGPKTRRRRPHTHTTTHSEFIHPPTLAREPDRGIGEGEGGGKGEGRMSVNSFQPGLPS